MANVNYLEHLGETFKEMKKLNQLMQSKYTSEGCKIAKRFSAVYSILLINSSSNLSNACEIKKKGMLKLFGGTSVTTENRDSALKNLVIMFRYQFFMILNKTIEEFIPVKALLEIDQNKRVISKLVAALRNASLHKDSKINFQRINNENNLEKDWYDAFEEQKIEGLYIHSVVPDNDGRVKEASYDYKPSMFLDIAIRLVDEARELNEICTDPI